MIVFVVGMARSGTSAVTGLLRSMGCVSLADKYSRMVGKWNPDYQENVVINALAEAIHPWHHIEPKKPSAIWTDAMCAYIRERVPTRPDTPIVLKSPAFPFIISELRRVADQLGMEAKFVVTRREKEAVVRSCDEFTGHRIGLDHWRTLYDVAYRKIDDEIGAEGVHIDYVYLIHDWVMAAKTLTQHIEGLTVPADGGIRADLNHEGLRDAG